MEVTILAVTSRKKVEAPPYANLPALLAKRERDVDDGRGRGLRRRNPLSPAMTFNTST